MSWITEYLRESVTVTPKGTMGKDGKYAFDGTAYSAMARVSDSKRTVRSASHDEVISDREFWMEHDCGIAIGDKILWNSTNHEVLQIYKPAHIDGSASHIKVWAKVL